VMQDSGFHDGHLRIDRKVRHVLVDGTEVILTRTQYRLLLCLASHPGEVLSYDQIIEEVWGTEYQGERERVHDCVRSLRKKIDPDPNRPGHIVSIPGEGYRFDPHN